MSKKKFLSAALSALLFLGVCGCGQEPENKTESQFFTMDTVITMTAYGDPAEDGLAAARMEIERLNDLLDPDDPGSALAAINAVGATGGEVPLVQEIRDLLDISKDVFRRSGCSFDPSLYPVIQLWGFGTESAAVPPADVLTETLDNTGFHKVLYDDTTLYMPPGFALTFGGIAKGYAAMQAAEALRAAGVESAILSLGGNIQTLGVKPDGSLWSVHITDPMNTGGALGALTIGADTAVVTSGGYHRYFEEDGIVYHHILDPSTGYPAESDLLSVTVVCADGTVADAFSTALFVAGQSAALAIAELNPDIELVLVNTNGEVIVTAGLADAFTPSCENYEYIILEE